MNHLSDRYTGRQVRRFQDLRGRLYELTTEQVFLADELRFTRDPFDGLIVAAAQTAALTLVTRDEGIRRSGAVRVMW